MLRGTSCGVQHCLGKTLVNNRTSWPPDMTIILIKLPTICFLVNSCLHSRILLIRCRNVRRSKRMSKSMACSSDIAEISAAFAKTVIESAEDNSEVPPLEHVPEASFKPRSNSAFISTKTQPKTRWQSNELSDDNILRNRHQVLSKIGELMFNSKGQLNSDDEEDEEDSSEEENEKSKPFCGFKPGFFLKEKAGEREKKHDEIIEVKSRGKGPKPKAPIVLDPETSKQANLKPFAVPANQTPEQHLHAMAMATGLTDKLLEEVKRDPELYSLLEDPKFGDILLEFQFNPDNALKRHSGNGKIMDAMRKFSATLRKHFEEGS